MKNYPQTEMTRIDVLKLPPNARIHPQTQLDKLRNSVSIFGIVRPILIDRDFVVVDGVAVMRIASELGYTEVPTQSVAHLSKAQIRALRLALNRIPEDAKWDPTVLKIEFEALFEAHIDLDYTGFDTVEIENVLEITSTAPGEGEELDYGKLGVAQPAITRPGDVWRCVGPSGEHRIACCDARDGQQLRQLFAGETAQVGVHDLPYNVPIANNVSGLGKKTHVDFAMASGEMPPAEFETFLTIFLIGQATWLDAGAIVFVFMDWRSIDILYAAGRRAGLDLVNLCVWTKTNAAMGNLYRSKHELVAVFKKPGASHRNNVQLGKYGRSRSNVWAYAGVNVFGADRKWLAEHPTPKPVALVADALRDVTRPGDIVFDAFLGSGTTLIAAERTRRRCFATEIAPTFVDVAIRRWQAETGFSAVRMADGQAFDAISNLRLLPPPADRLLLGGPSK